VTVHNKMLDDITPPRSFAHSVRSWDCGGRWGLRMRTMEA